MQLPRIDPIDIQAEELLAARPTDPNSEVEIIWCAECATEYKLATFCALPLMMAYNFETEPAHFELHKCACGVLLHIYTDSKGILYT